MLTRTLKATGRSLLFSIGRAGVRVGSVVTPQRTARHLARRFFTTSRSAPERRRFAAEAPRIESVQLPDGPVVSYTWGDTGCAPTVLLVHGWNGWAQQLEAFVEPLLARGYAVLAFDHVAHGASIGEQATLPIMIRSVQAMLRRVPHPAGAIAHSLGAAAVAAAMANDADAVPAAVLIAPPTDPRPYLRFVARGLGAPDVLLDDVQREAETTAGVPLAALVFDHEFARRLERPLLVVHDSEDTEVSIAHGRVYAKARQARLLATSGLGHRRILRDPHVVESSVHFIAEWRDARPVRSARASFTPAKVPGREHREMLADVGAI
ncbi:MAG TPA: alpha/beta fold hydrolase [Burkholderiaceae bacterium]|nr:alpha/beta fold hydrolase [Burkholderiaceae bacterium]